MHDIVVVIASFNRRKLIQQTIESIQKNSVMDVKIVVVDNSIDKDTPKYLKSLKDIIYYRFPKLDEDYEYAEHVMIDNETGRKFAANTEESPYWNHRMTVGKCYNQGSLLAPPSEYILFTQNDMYYLPGWDKAMTNSLKKYKDLAIVSGYAGSSGTDRGDIYEHYKIQDVGLVAGSSLMFRRKDWNQLGYIPDYNEDNWISYEVRGGWNKKLGLIYPYCIIHCGYTSTLVGGAEVERTKTGDWNTVEAMMKEYPEIYYE